MLKPYEKHNSGKDLIYEVNLYYSGEEEKDFYGFVYEIKEIVAREKVLSDEIDKILADIEGE